MKLKGAKNVLDGNLVVVWGGKVCNAGPHRKKIVGSIRQGHNKTWKLLTLDGKHLTVEQSFPTAIFTYGEVELNQG